MEKSNINLSKEASLAYAFDKYRFHISLVFFTLGLYCMSLASNISTITAFFLLLLPYTHLVDLLLGKRANNKFTKLISMILYVGLFILGLEGLKHTKHLPMLKKDEYMHLSDPYEYPQFSHPSNVKKITCYSNNKLYTIKHFRNGLQVANSYTSPEDSSDIVIWGTVFNEHNEILKTYEISDVGITIDTFITDEALMVERKNKVFYSTVPGKLPFIRDLSYEDLISEKWLASCSDSMIVLGTSTQYAIYENGLKKRAVSMLYDDTLSVEEFKYNESDQLVYYKSRLMEGGKINICNFEYSSTLTEKNNKKKKTIAYYREEQSLKDPKSKLLSHVKYLYNEQGSLLKQDINTNGERSSTIFEYNTKGQLIREKTVAEDGVNIDYTYNKQGLLHTTSYGGYLTDVYHYEY